MLFHSFVDLTESIVSKPLLEDVFLSQLVDDTRHFRIVAVKRIQCSSIRGTGVSVTFVTPARPGYAVPNGWTGTGLLEVELEVFDIVDVLTRIAGDAMSCSLRLELTEEDCVLEIDGGSVLRAVGKWIRVVKVREADRVAGSSGP